jgi:hypothetical protein
MHPGEEFNTFSGGGAQDMETEAGEGMVDLSGVDPNAGPPVAPRGTYDAFLCEMVYGQSQRSGNNMWTMKFELDTSAGEFAGMKCWHYATFTPESFPAVKRMLARIKTETGIEKQLLEQKFSPEKVADEGLLLNARCRLRLDIEAYRGVKRNKIKEILPPAAGGGGFGGM